MVKTSVLLLLGLALAACQSDLHSQPVTQSDPCRPDGGFYCEINLEVANATARFTVCDLAWLARQLPSAVELESLKETQMRTLQLNGALTDYVEDWRLPTELGGAARERVEPYLKLNATLTLRYSNLSPLPRSLSSEKTRDATAFKQAVCQGQMLLEEAQWRWRDKWLLPWPGYRR